MKHFITMIKSAINCGGTYCNSIWMLHSRTNLVRNIVLISFQNKRILIKYYLSSVTDNTIFWWRLTEFTVLLIRSIDDTVMSHSKSLYFKYRGVISSFTDDTHLADFGGSRWAPSLWDLLLRKQFQKLDSVQASSRCPLNYCGSLALLLINYVYSMESSHVN